MKWFNYRVASVLAALVVPRLVGADVVVLTHGTVIRGNILQQTPDSVVMRSDYGILTFARPTIKQVSKDRQRPSPEKHKSSDSLPSWDRIVDHLAEQKWATGLRQIPATVIDKGVLRHVPYMSFQCGTDYEVNIYGDPDDPAGFEIGIHRSLLDKKSPQDRCVQFVKDLLPSNAAKEAVVRLNRKQGTTSLNELTLEVTPPTAEDSYGGWWVSAYYDNKLASARASEPELAEITVPKSQVDKVSVAANSAAPATATSSSQWSTSDLRLARPTPSRQTGSASTGEVYVRGYHRKDGTYVSPHTRSRPRR